jgi:hypothetical protein
MDELLKMHALPEVTRTANAGRAAIITTFLLCYGWMIVTHEEIIWAGYISLTAMVMYTGEEMMATIIWIVSTHKEIETIEMVTEIIGVETEIIEADATKMVLYFSG